MRVIIAFVLLFGSSIDLYSQNVVYMGSKSFPSTSTWHFKTEHASPNGLSVTVAKTTKGGYLMLVADVPNTEIFTITGTISIFLEGGKLLTLTQRVASDNLDGNSQVLYAINPTNYASLKNENIVKIRFSILNRWVKTKENFTASNSKFGESVFESNKYATAEEITALDN